jgi:hypothetical protein
MHRLSRAGIAVVLLVGVLRAGGVAEAERLPSAVTVCVNASSGVLRLVAFGSECVGGVQSWSASQPAPLLCWNASSLDPQVGTRLVSVAPSSGCVAPLRPVPVGNVVLLCADGKIGLLRWPVTGSCRSGATPIRVRSAATPTTVATTIPTTTTFTTLTTSTTAVVVPSVTLSATLIQGGTFPKAVIVTTNVAGTIYFAEGAFVVKTVADITSAPSYRWAKGTVTTANTPTSIAIDVDALTNGYYRVFVANSQGVLSAPATNNVTISVPRPPTAAEIAAGTTTTTTTTTVALSCATGGVCAVGDTGPGGGKVYYVHASGTFNCGATLSQNCKYLEVAPNTWNGGTDPTKLWAITLYQSTDVTSITNDAAAYNNALGIGLGYKNSLAIVGQGNDTTTAAGAALAYAGGSQSDWYLPTTAELNLLCQWARNVAQSVTTACTGGILNTGTGASGGFSSASYWSSSEYSDLGAWGQVFYNGLQYAYLKIAPFYVRPVRAF